MGLSHKWGCSPSTVGGPAEAGQAILLATEPEGGEGVNGLKSTILAGLNSDGTDVLVCRVGGGGNETWDPDKAAFLVRDLDVKVETHDEGHGDEGDDCPFCRAAKKKVLESLALVQVVDQEGDVIPTDARQLLGLQEEQVIVAEGEAEVEDGTLVFSASRVFVRPSEP